MRGFRYQHAQDRDAWRALRTQLYIDSSLIGVGDLDHDGLYRDQYDERSDPFFIERAEGMRVGTFRIIDGRRGPLQVADEFGIPTEPDGYEISGFALGKAYHATGASVGVYRAAYRLGVERGYTTAYMEVEDWLLSSLRAMGLPVRVLGSPRWTFNATNYALAIPLAEVVDSLREADSARNHRTRYGDLFDEDDYSFFLPSTVASDREAIEA